MDNYKKFEQEFIPQFGWPWTNSLTGKVGVTEADNGFANEIWEKFGCTSIGDYHDLYLKTDVILLVVIFENFRDDFKSTYDLDPCHYYSAPNISWDAMLKTTGFELELLSDIDMLLFCEKAIRGGLNGIGEKRLMKANNPYLSDYGKNVPKTYGLFLDVVNLYGGTMMKQMPVGSFKWVEKNIQNILDTSDESDQGYFVMVDLCYPKDLHDLRNDFPLAAENLKIRKHYLSDYQKQFDQRETETAKLMETRFDKVNYVCHYSVLKFYVQQGMRVTKLHKTLQFCQSSFLKPYIDLNTTKRQEHGISEFKKNFFKMLINSCFGKPWKI